MISKRNFLLATAALTFGALAGLSPAWAIGGNDPISGIDIIIKKNPGSKPIKPFSFGDAEVEKLNALKDAQRPQFVLETIAARLDVGEGFAKAGMVSLGKVWCAPCKMLDSFEVKFPFEDATYTIGLTLEGGDAARPTRLQGKAAPKN